MCACLGELFLMINVFFIFFQMSFSADFKIVDRFCKCARGVAGCAHMAAVFLLAQKEVSPTEMECKWSRRKAPEDDAILTVDKLYQRKRKFEPNYGPVPRETFETLKKDVAHLKSAAGVRFLLEDPPIPRPVPQLQIPDAFSLITGSEFDSEHPEEYLCRKLRLSWPEIVEIANATKDQGLNPEWSRVRIAKITASNFGKVISYMKRGTTRSPARTLMESLYLHRDLSGVKAVEWGKVHEKTAIKQFMRDNNVVVRKTGIWFEGSGILGASPDGLIGDDMTVEVKCLWSVRLIEPEVALSDPKNFKKWCLFCDNGVWKIDRDHDFYHQMQGAIHFTNRKSAYFVVWTTKGLKSAVIQRDESWKSNIVLLKRFYFEHFVPYLRSL